MRKKKNKNADETLEVIKKILDLPYANFKWAKNIDKIEQKLMEI